MRPSETVMGIMAALKREKAEKEEKWKAEERAKIADKGGRTDAERDALAIVRRPDGSLFARVAAGDKIWTHDLPLGFETWDGGEQRSHLGRFVVPWLKSKAEAWRRDPAFTEGTEHSVPLIAEHKTVSGEEVKSVERQEQKLDAAEAKREKRRNKLQQQQLKLVT